MKECKTGEKGQKGDSEKRAKKKKYRSMKDQLLGIYLFCVFRTQCAHNCFRWNRSKGIKKCVINYIYVFYIYIYS
jgi:hypothetical protein